MEGTSLYCLAFYDAATQEKLSTLQRALFDAGFIGRQTGGIPHHITLGEFPTNEEAALAGRLRGVASEVGSFELGLSSLGLFGLSVLFVAPDVNRPLLELRDRLGDGAPWTAHTTMLIDEPEVVLRALPVLSAAFKPMVARVESIRLYAFWPSRLIAEATLP